VESGTGQFGHGQRCQSLLDRNIDDCAELFCHCGVHAGTRGSDAANVGGLFAHRADRRFSQIVHLPRQQSRDATGEQQRQVSGRIVCLWAGLAERRD
jgi:hypothetical protein